MTAPGPLVTIAMPCLDEAGFIEACLESVRAQNYPRDRLEILVADGGSRDGTREILERLARADPRIRVLDNPGRIQAAGLNRILAEARGDVIVRMDVHCDYAPDYVAKCIAVLERTGADNVGGPPRCHGRSSFQRAVCAALRSPLGAGGAPQWDTRREGFVHSVPFGALRRDTLQAMGGFDPRAVTNEDAELNQRLIAAGRRVYLSPEIVFSYYPRASFAGLARQYFRYGQGRARTLVKHRGLLSLRPALPFLALLGGLGMAALKPFAALGLAALYAFVSLAEAIRVGRRDGWRVALLAWLVFPTLLVAHGLGFGAGLARSLLAPDW
jgi:cellulose synthase/poly-beta-1,6-N-acetylglucosamine synthase-like glycosyltransferase